MKLLHERCGVFERENKILVKRLKEDEENPKEKEHAQSEHRGDRQELDHESDNMTPQLFDERGFGSLEIETDEDREVAASVNAETNSDPTAEDDAGETRYDSGREGKGFNSGVCYLPRCPGRGGSEAKPVKPKQHLTSTKFSRGRQYCSLW